MNIKHYTYRVIWSPEDNEHLGLCAEFPSLSWLAKKLRLRLKALAKLWPMWSQTCKPVVNPLREQASTRRPAPQAVDCYRRAFRTFTPAS